jgi:hypothetical protein
MLAIYPRTEDGVRRLEEDGTMRSTMAITATPATKHKDSKSSTNH